VSPSRFSAGKLACAPRTPNHPDHGQIRTAAPLHPGTGRRGQGSGLPAAGVPLSRWSCPDLAPPPLSATLESGADATVENEATGVWF
jgi:hypothetical protein